MFSRHFGDQICLWFRFKFKTVKLKQTFHLILLYLRHTKCAKSHKQCQFTSKFILTSVCDIFKQSNLMDQAILRAVSFTLNTNWQLKNCIWRLYFSSWSPKGNLRIFSISNPACQSTDNVLPRWPFFWTNFQLAGHFDFGRVHGFQIKLITGTINLFILNNSLIYKNS